MSNMNSRQRAKKFAELLERDGVWVCDPEPRLTLQCSNPICKKEVNWDTSIIDHCDNDNGNNDTPNLKILCRSCNYLKNPAEKVKQLENMIEVTASQKFSSRYESHFIRWLYGRIMLEGKLKKEDAINEGALETGSHIPTITRYVKKWVNKHPKSIFEEVELQESVIFIVFKKSYKQQMGISDDVEMLQPDGRRYNDFEKSLMRENQGLRFPEDDDYQDWLSHGKPNWNYSIKPNILPLSEWQQTF